MDNLDAKKQEIDEEIQVNKVMLYMKGNRMAPQCGFSAQVIQILNHLGVAYETRDVLSDPELREAIKQYSDWPTIPQLYVNQEFIGGCDIVTELFENGELEEIVAA